MEEVRRKLIKIMKENPEMFVDNILEACPSVSGIKCEDLCGSDKFDECCKNCWMEAVKVFDNQD